MANSNEDGKLDGSIRVVKERLYKDLDLSFAARTTTDGDVFRKNDAAAVKQALKSLILTNRFEKPYRPNYGADLSSLLFELADADTGDEIIQKIKSAVERYEPRVKILALRVSATPDYNAVDVVIEFRVVATGVVDVLKVVLDTTISCEPPFKPAPPFEPYTGEGLMTEYSQPIITEAGINISVDDGFY
jgi:phage baseplate assembly protein W